MSIAKQHPGAILQERYLQPLGITPSELAKSIGISAQQVSELIAGRHPITPDMAARLALFFDVPAHWWLIHQARYDAEHVPLDAVRKVVKPYRGLSNVLVTPHGVKRLAPSDDLPAKTLKATFSTGFLDRLRAQVDGAEDRPRTISETTLADGTVALFGK